MIFDPYVKMEAIMFISSVIELIKHLVDEVTEKDGSNIGYMAWGHLINKMTL